ncbi:ImpA family metalloprotease [Serratia quinivorans]|uniref:ImpA family metalloprotease n=1 Tax=Serratia quinivorans TaxID=137545 RepID=UPI0021791982|nr:ImpA family metalloprotease [Serratia quinivorans]CAI1115026.1 Uncharacterised protein [Serratia quinivorans]CAI1876466.1 Uncharacterised protein [Serratia quinivorans]
MNKKLILRFILMAAVGISQIGCDNSSDNSPQNSIEPAVPLEPSEPIDPGDGGDGGDEDDKFNHAIDALKKQDSSLATENELIDYSLYLTRKKANDDNKLLKELYKDVNQDIDWDTTHDSIYFSDSINNTSVLFSNIDAKGNKTHLPLIIVGEKSGHRYSALARSLLLTAERANPSTDQLMVNIINWLISGSNKNAGTYSLNKTDKTKKINIVTTELMNRSDSQYSPFYEGLVDWMAIHMPDYTINSANSCDGNLLTSCLEQPVDLLIVGDRDANMAGYESIEKGIKIAISQGIPILTLNRSRNDSKILAPIYEYMGVDTYNNYWVENKVQKLPVSEILKGENYTDSITLLLENLKSKKFNNSELKTGSNPIFRKREDESEYFNKNFKEGANIYRQQIIKNDMVNNNSFEKNTLGDQIISLGVLLAEKYRSEIDYPIDLATESTSPLVQRALFSDWVVNYSWAKNKAQPDLGDYVTEIENVTLNNKNNYAYPPVENDRKIITVPESKSWTTTGWYALPGQAVTLTRNDSSSATVRVQLNFQRPNTNKLAEYRVYSRPLELNTQRIEIKAGSSIVFSTPYGGPIYIYIEGENGSLKTDISAKGIAKHPTITDFNDQKQVSEFEETLKNTELPHVDIRTTNAEFHMRKDKFTGSIKSDCDSYDCYKDVQELLDALNNHVNTVYTLAGYKTGSDKLENTLPTEVINLCTLFSSREDCIDDDLHNRNNIQHANYDQYAQCGSGCSGNPRDGSWNINPHGWGDNHELGHNLQTSYMSVNFAPPEEKDSWGKYKGRSGENSNNIFPYFMFWKLTNDPGTFTKPTTNHTSGKDLFSVFMSDALKLKAPGTQNRIVVNRNCNIYRTIDGSAESPIEIGNRYLGPWKDSSYAANNSYRMAFYIQMPLHADKQTMRGGEKLENGYNLYTLLYLHSRIFNKYSKSQSDWDSHKFKLGFQDFPYNNNPIYDGKTVNQIPGNDFLLVSLSYITDMDWRPYFDLFGLSYTSLASNQVDKNGFSKKVSSGMFVLESEIPGAGISEGLDFLPLSEEDPTTVWPRDNWSPKTCALN